MDAKKLQTEQGFQEFKGALDNAVVKLYPVIKWGNRTYIVLQQPKLQVAVQTLDVIDATDENIACIAPSWPQAAYDPTHAIVIHPFEGWPAVVILDDGTEWQAYIAALPVLVTAPSPRDAREALDEVDEYDIAMVDAGAQLQIR